MCVGRKTGVRIGKIWSKGQDWMAKTPEGICEGVANRIGRNKDSQIIIYNI